MILSIPPTISTNAAIQLILFAILITVVITMLIAKLQQARRMNTTLMKVLVENMKKSQEGQEHAGSESTRQPDTTAPSRE